MSGMARPKVHTADLRRRLLDVAVAITTSDGFGALTVRTVAQAAGTSTTAVYSLFGSMADLQLGVVIRAFESFASAQESVGSSADPDHDIAGLGIMYVQWALDNPRLFEVMFSPTASGLTPTPEFEQSAARAMTPLADAVQRAVDSGRYKPGEPSTIVVSLWSSVHGLAQLLLAGLVPPDADPARAALATLHGWRATPGTSPEGGDDR